MNFLKHYMVLFFFLVFFMGTKVTVQAQQCNDYTKVNQWACVVGQNCNQTGLRCDNSGIKCLGDLECGGGHCVLTCTGYGSTCQVYSTNAKCSGCSATVPVTDCSHGSSQSGDCTETSGSKTFGCLVLPTSPPPENGATDPPAQSCAWCSNESYCLSRGGTWGGANAPACDPDSDGCCYAPGGGGGEVVTPPPPTVRTCGQPCSSDEVCQRASASTHCYKGYCSRIGCDGYTQPGSNCECAKPASCGERCGKNYGHCIDGYTCGFVTNPNQCAATENSSTLQRCLPDIPHGFYSTQGCFDSSNKYLVKPDGVTPATYVAGSNNMAAVGSDLDLACNAPPPTYTVKVCTALRKKETGAFLTDWSIIGQTTFSVDLSYRDLSSEIVDLQTVSFTNVGATNDVVDGIPAKCQTIVDTRDTRSYLYSLESITPTTSHWGTTLYNDDIPVTPVNSLGQYIFDSLSYADGEITFDWPNDLSRTLLIVNEYSDTSYCDGYKYAIPVGHAKADGTTFATFRSSKNQTFIAPNDPGYQTIGYYMRIGDAGTNWEYKPTLTSTETIDLNTVTNSPETRYSMTFGAGKICGISATGYVDVCTTSSHNYFLNDYDANPTRSLTQFVMSMHNRRKCKDGDDSCADGTVTYSDVRFIEKQREGCIPPGGDITSQILIDPSTSGGIAPGYVGSATGGYCTTTSASSPHAGGSIEAVNSTTADRYLGDIASSGTYSFRELPITGTDAYTITYTPPEGYQCSCPIGCVYTGRTPSAAPEDTSNWKFYITPVSTNWYQVQGGDVGAMNTSGKSVTDLIPTGCTTPLCLPYLSIPSVSTRNETSGGLFVGAGSTVDLRDTVGNQNTNANPGTSHASYQSLTNTCKENYSYFYRLYSLGVTVDAANILTTTDKPASKLEGAYYHEGAMTLDAAEAAWSVANGEQIVIFVHGNLTIAHPITVEKGGFLAFIVSGNITIDPSVGTSTLTSTSPGQVQGIYVADGSITVASTNDVATAEKKFIGEGTFAACKGISLPRNFINGSNGGNNMSYPTSLFIFRPDFVLNAPKKMRVPVTNWHEVIPQ